MQISFLVQMALLFGTRQRHALSMSCQSGVLRRAFFTGMATSLSFLVIVLSALSVIQSPTDRKRIVLLGACIGFVSCILNTFFYTVSGHQDIMFQQYMTIGFLSTLLCVSIASCKRYFIYEEPQNQQRYELISNLVISAVVMYGGALYFKVLNYRTSRWGILILGVIPVGHIILGVMLFFRQAKKNVHENSLSYSLASRNMYVNIINISLWLIWILLFALGISAADLESFLLALCLASEHSIAILATQAQRQHQIGTGSSVYRQSQVFTSPLPSRNLSRTKNSAQ
jgi:hypothetical protein